MPTGADSWAPSHYHCAGPLITLVDRACRLYPRSLVSSFLPAPNSTPVCLHCPKSHLFSSAISGFKCRHDKLVKSDCKQLTPASSAEGFFGLTKPSSALFWSHFRVPSPVLSSQKSFSVTSTVCFGLRSGGHALLKYASRPSGSIH